MVGVYPPWLDYKWGYPTGVPVKNPILADVPSFIYPMQMFAIDVLKSGKIPLWNPFILTGTPLLANFQSAPFSPTNFVYFLFDRLNAWSIQIVLQHVLSAIFTYLLLRRWKVSKFGSILGGVIFAFSGFNLIWSLWNGHALAASFIPLILLFEDKYLEEGKVLDVMGFCFSLVLQFLSGYPQILIYTSLAVITLWFIRIELNRKYITKSFCLFFYSLLSFGMTAFQTLPGKELLDLSQRSVELHPFEWAFLPFSKVITFLAPDFFGNHATGNYWGPQDYTSNTGFVGVIAFTLAFFSLSLIKKNKKVLFAVILALLSLLLAFSTPVSVFFWKSGVLGFNAASAHRSLVLWNLAISLLAGFGLDILNKQFRLKYKILVVVIPFFILLGFGVYAFKIHQIVGLRNLILPTLVLLLGTVALFLRLKIVFVLLATIELFYFGWKFVPFSPKALVFPETPILKFLKSQSGPYRVVADRVIPINFLMNYGIETLEGYDAVYPKTVSEFIAKINGSYGSLNSIRRYGIIDNYDSDLLDLANVKYLVIKEEDVDRYLKNKKFKIAFKDKSVIVLENLIAFPRAFILGDERFKNSNIKFLKYGNEENQIRVETKKQGTLFVSDLYYPGWKAYVDGDAVEIHKIEPIFRSIEVPMGIHEIRFVYKPESFYNGLKISGFSMMVFVGLFGYTLFIKTKNDEV